MSEDRPEYDAEKRKAEREAFRRDTQAMIDRIPLQCLLLERFSSRHGAILRKPEIMAVGCYYCGSAYDKSEIREWIDHGDTALCPRCTIDAVVPAIAVLGIFHGGKYNDLGVVLEEMHKHWFSIENAWCVRCRKSPCVCNAELAERRKK